MEIDQETSLPQTALEVAVSSSISTDALQSRTILKATGEELAEHVIDY